MRGIESLPVFLLPTEGSNHHKPMTNTTGTNSLCYSNAEWLTNQINYARQQFHDAIQREHTELRDFWADRWNRLERHYRDLRSV
jgi:hypothetical protein